ncbi:flagellar protein FlbD [Actinosynnema pretiosum]|uniref:Flagellar protein FlbD n=1 Tax=Actinosynnema pretiosum TaxID=42197 RepID=A0A290Z4K1_9PSEU|nr:flagellar protein FlbD [Actinosynnema pretiosum]
MIVLNRLNGQPFALNPDLIERAESNPDTVVTLLSGAKYVVAQTIEEISDLVRRHRAGVLSLAQDPAPAEHPPVPRRRMRVAPDPVEPTEPSVLRLPTDREL